MRDILKEQGLDDKVYKPSLVLHRISTAKNNLFNYQDYQNNTDLVNDDNQSGKPKLGLLFELYAKRCFKASAMDFDDILYNTYRLLSVHHHPPHKYFHVVQLIFLPPHTAQNSYPETHPPSHT